MLRQVLSRRDGFAALQACDLTLNDIVPFGVFCLCVFASRRETFFGWVAQVSHPPGRIMACSHSSSCATALILLPHICHLPLTASDERPTASDWRPPTSRHFAEISSRLSAEFSPSLADLSSFRLFQHLALSYRRFFTPVITRSFEVASGPGL